MSLTHITTAVDHEKVLKGDVVLIKRTYVTPKGRMFTICTRCGDAFPTTLRRMSRIGGRRACEVRNIPQCPKCRSRYAKAKREAARVPALPLWQAAGRKHEHDFREGDLVRIDSTYAHMDDNGYAVGQVHRVEALQTVMGDVYLGLAGGDHGAAHGACRFSLVEAAK